MEGALVSVVMPAYNAARYIGISIQSILSQSFRSFELLIVNDGSTDSTEAIAREYAKRDHRIRVLQNRNGKGISGALNTGLEDATADLIARADADDICRPCRLRMQFSYMKRNPDIMMVGGAYLPFSENGPSENGRRAGIFHPTSPVEIAWRFLSASCFCHPSVMFRRAVFEELGGYPDVVAEDYAYFSSIVKRYKCANLTSILIDYRESTSNLSNLNAGRIITYVEDRFLENFRHYAGNCRHAQSFHDFHVKNMVALGELFRMLAISSRILERIRRDYRIRGWDFAYIRVFLLVMWRCWIAVFRPFLKRARAALKRFQPGFGS